jgi:hypothetical protein
MAPIPSEAEEEARRACREGEDLTGERRSMAPVYFAPGAAPRSSREISLIQKPVARR